MGGNEDISEEIIEVGGNLGERPPKGCLTALTALLTVLTMIIGVIVKFSMLGSHVLAGTAHCLLVLAAIGWGVRGALRARIGYLRRVDIENISPWTLPLFSFADATFSLVWLGVAILILVGGARPLTTAVAVMAICLTSFVLAMVTHRAAQAARRPRASEWVCDKYRDLLEAGKTTWIGWLLVSVIDRRSPEDLLSTYVSGSLATLLIVLLLTASAALSEGAKDEPKAEWVASKISEPEMKKTKNPATSRGSQPSNPESVVNLPETSVPIVGAIKEDAEAKAVDLYCLMVKVTTEPMPLPAQTQRLAYLCSILAEGQPTNKFLVLVPQPKR